MNMNKETIKKGLEKLNNLLKTAGRVTIVVIALGTGFMGGEIYHNYKVHTAMSNMQEPKKTELTSVAINERGELMVIDRSKGSYLLYDKAIGEMIFNLYANRIYNQTQSK